MSLRTRSRAKHFCLGPPRSLPTNQLPTNKDVINYIRLLHGEQPNVRAKVLSDNIFKPVAARVIEMWTGEGIPAMQMKGVQRKVAGCYKQYQKLNKVKTAERGLKKPASEKVQNFFGNLFDIALCRCKDVSHCSCPRDRKVPVGEISFLKDQRRSRRMMLRGIDRDERARRQAAASRKWRRRQAEEQQPSDRPAGLADGRQHSRDGAGPSEMQDVAIDDEGCHVSDASSGDHEMRSDDDWAEGGVERLAESGDTLTNTALAADRFGLSNRSVAAIVNAFQLDIGRASREKPKLLLDPQKVWRESSGQASLGSGQGR